MNSRGNAVFVSLLGAMLIPEIQKRFNITLTTEDVADLLAAALLIWHGAASAFEKYFPPPKEPKSG